MEVVQQFVTLMKAWVFTFQPQYGFNIILNPFGKILKFLLELLIKETSLMFGWLAMQTIIMRERELI